MTLTTYRTRYGLVDGPSPIVSQTANRRTLCALFGDLGLRSGAEIGVWEGDFSKLLFAAVPGLRLRCVDRWQAYGAYRDKKNDQARLDAAYQRTVDQLSGCAATILRMGSLEAAAEVPDGSLDFVYIDANHGYDYVLADLKAWAPKVRTGGIVSGHDYVAQPKQKTAHLEVAQAVDEFTRTRQIDPWFVLAADKYPSFFWVVA